MTNKKGQMGILVALILGILVLGLIMYSVSKIPTTWNSFSKGVKELDTNKLIVSNESYNFTKSLPEDARVAAESAQVLTDAVTALVDKTDIKGNGETLKNLRITYYAKFKYYVNNVEKHMQSSCDQSFSAEGKNTIDCKQVLSSRLIYADAPYFMENEKNSIDVVYTFDVTYNGKTCPSRENKIITLPQNSGSDATYVDIKTKLPNLEVFNGNDLQTHPNDKDCNAAYNYIVCNGIKVYYCGKSGWSITSLVEKTTDADTFNVNNRDGILNVIGDALSNAIDFGLQNGLGINTDKRSYAYCEDGRVVGSGDTEKCLSCDMSANNGKGKCSLVGFELPQKVSNINDWIPGYGDPNFILYYEAFPQGEEEAWQVSKMTMLSMSLTAGTIALDFIPLVGKGAGIAIKKFAPEIIQNSITVAGKAISRGKNYVADKTIGAAGRAIKDNFNRLIGRDSEQLVEASLLKLAKVSPELMTTAKGTQLIYIKVLTLESLEGVPGAVKTSGYLDDVITPQLLSKFLREDGKLTETAAEDLSQTIKDAYIKKLNSNPELLDGYIKDAAYYIRQNGATGTDDEIYALAKKQILEDGPSGLKQNMKEALSDPNNIKDINSAIANAVDNYLSAEEKSFVANFQSLFKKTKVARTADEQVEKLFDDAVGAPLTKALDTMKNNPAAKEALFAKSDKILQKVEQGESLNWRKLLGDDASSEDIAAVSKSMDGLSQNPKYVNLFDQLKTIKGSGRIKRSGELATAAAIAVYSAWMDSANEKYTPAGYNVLALSEVSKYEERLIKPLSDGAKDLFIRLDKQGRDNSFTSRFFLASPCKTDLDIRIQKCSCSVESVVSQVNGQWTGYLKKTETGYVPVKNVDPDSKFTLVSFDKTDTRAAGVKIAEAASVATPGVGIITAVPYVLNENALSTKVSYPVLDDGADVTYAVKECNTRGWFDSQVFVFNNVDVETDCVNIAESDQALEKYKDYNGGKNFCYAGSNSAGEGLKAAITLVQVGASIAVGSTGVGLVAVPLISIAATAATMGIDEASKWPANTRGVVATDYGSQVSDAYSSGSTI